MEQGGAGAGEQEDAGGHHGGNRNWTLLNNQLRKISRRGEKHAAIFTLRKNDIEYTRRNGEGWVGTNKNAEKVTIRSAENQAAVRFAGTAFCSN